MSATTSTNRPGAGTTCASTARRSPARSTTTESAMRSTRATPISRRRTRRVPGSAPGTTTRSRTTTPTTARSASRRDSCSGAPLQESLLEALRAVVGVVVLDLVVVPGADPGTRRVRRLEIGVALVERMADSVVVERAGLRRAVLAHVVPAPGRFVDVVADMDDQVEVVRQHVAVRGEVALFVLLTRGEREPQAIASGILGWRG